MGAEAVGFGDRVEGKVSDEAEKTPRGFPGGVFFR